MPRDNAVVKLERRAGLHARSWARIAGMWLRAAYLGDARAECWLAERNIPLSGSHSRKAMADNIDASGGFLVPTIIAQMILWLLDNSGIARQCATVVPMTSDAVTITRRDGEPTAYVIAEGVAVTESQGAWGSVTLTARKLATYTKFSTELDEDSVIPLGAAFLNEIAHAFATTEDRLVFTGTGVASDAGIVGIAAKIGAAGLIAAASGHDTLAKIDATDLGNLMAALPAYCFAGARWFVSGYGFGACFGRLGATAGQRIADEADLELPGEPPEPDDMLASGVILRPMRPALEMSFLGFPVSMVPCLPGSGSQAGKSVIHFGDLSAAVILGTRREVRLRVSQHRHLEGDQLAALGTERFDAAIHNAGDGTTPGAVVALTCSS